MPATDVYWRNLRKMHIWFALSAVLLIVATIWMLGDDHRREYFEYQRTFYRIQALKAQAQIDAIQDAKYQQKKRQLEADIAAAKEDLKSDDKAKEIEDARDKLNEAELNLTLAEKALKLLNSRLGVARADYDLAVRDERGKAVIKRLKAAYDDLTRQVTAQKTEVERLQRIRDEAKEKLSSYTRRLDELQTELKDLTEEVDLLRKSKLQVAPESWGAATKRKIMEWPILQGFNSHLRVHQDWLPNLKITLGMTKTARFDRCRTCHLGADHIEVDKDGNIKPAYPYGKLTQKEADEFHEARRGSGETPEEKWGPHDPRLWVAKNQFPHPYATHPNPDLYMTASSPHPVSTFGCTICHDGNGSGTSFQNAEHGPNSPHEAGKWKKEHHYHSNHFWEYPMQPKRLLQSTCIKCHHQVEELGTHPKFGASAPQVFQGYRLIQRYGCFGCHEVHGYEGDKSIGPDLRLEPNYTEAALQFGWLVDRQVDRLIAAKKENGSVRPSGLVKDQFEYVQALDEFERQQNAPNAKAGPKISRPTPPAFRGLLDHIINEPGDSAAARAALSTLINRDVKARSKARQDLSRQRGLSAEQRKQSRNEIERNHLSLSAGALVDQFKDVAHPGRYRKVGPSLRYIASKVPKEFIPYWTEEPKRFRPSTRMPQFFKLTNLQDAHGAQLSATELIAVGEYLYAKSQEFKPLPIHPKAELPDKDRGKKAFEERGCIACHSHKEVKGANPDFGPDLTLIAAKIKRDKYNDKSQQADFSHWLYTWIRQPHRYHKRSRMPYLFLDDVKEETKPVDGKRETKYYDVAADITAYLLSSVADEAKAKQQEFQQRTAELRKTGLKHVDELAKLYLRKSLTQEKVDLMYRDQRYPITDIARIKGDEMEFVHPDGKSFSDEEFQQAKLRYVGRRTISRYGCYACHDIPGFERARPIGTTLQDWGRKDRTKIAFEHIGEYLKHHGEKDGSSTATRARQAVLSAATGSKNGDKQDELAVAYYYDSLLHHDRPGFIWQKLRAPRSYDYEKIETKNYDERLRMPMFPFNEQEIEKIATFVLGLVAEPPEKDYLYQPTGPPAARIEGERLLQKYNCTGCHMVELPEVTLWADLTKGAFKTGGKNQPEPFGTKLLHELMPPREVKTNVTRTVEVLKKPVKQTRLSFHGLPVFSVKEADDVYFLKVHVFENWEHLEIDGSYIRPGPRKVNIAPDDLISIDPGRGGDFAEWLFTTLKQRKQKGDGLKTDEGDSLRQRLPPVLYREGYKVQTPWLFRFLRDPHALRPMVVLRMPRFNMSAAEAQSLANYFAAVDGQPYPYQQVPQRKPEYAEQKTRELWDLIKDAEHPDYLSQAFRQLTNQVCRKCHLVGGFELVPDPKSVQGPNLGYAADRLRPEWLQLWIGYPTYVLPYTGMLQNFKPGSPRNPQEVFHGDSHAQWIAVRDALMNYNQLMERHRNTKFKYPMPPDKTKPNPAPVPKGLNSDRASDKHPTRRRRRHEPSEGVRSKKAIIKDSSLSDGA